MKRYQVFLQPTPRLHSKSLGLVRENMGFCKFVRTFALWLEGRGWSQVELS